MKEIKDLFLDDDIFPLGNFETLPVEHLGNGEASGYPDVCVIQDHVDSAALVAEAHDHMAIVGFTYVKGRLEHLNPDVDEDLLRSVLGDVGFKKGTYQSFSLRKLGTNQLEDWVGPSTRQFFESLPVSVFRQQYATAYPGWNIKLHRDHRNFKTHGFRAMVPLNTNVYMAYEDDQGKNIVYKLTPGRMYFVNIAKMHRGFNESESEDRINLIMQMDSDRMVVNGKPMEPISNEELNQLPVYAREYDIWRFGREL